MKKYAILFLTGIAAALAFAQVSEAGWICRRHCSPRLSPCPPICCPCPACPLVYYPCPQPLAQQPPLLAERVVVGTKGRYRLIDTGEKGEFFEKDTPTSPFADVPEDDFAGHDRKKAKTSIATADAEPPYANVGDLITTLPTDATMLALGISKDATSDRVSRENRNVAVKGFIYAVKSEDDHDFHVILGMSPDSDTKAFLNVEVSGLPQGGPNRLKLLTPRSAFKTFFGDHGDQFGSSYKKFDPPIPVRIEGSLFFDVDHRAGVVGPQGMRPKTAWEIHPVTKIEFEIDP